MWIDDPLGDLVHLSVVLDRRRLTASVLDSYCGEEDRAGDRVYNVAGRNSLHLEYSLYPFKANWLIFKGERILGGRYMCSAEILAPEVLGHTVEATGYSWDGL